VAAPAKKLTKDDLKIRGGIAFAIMVVFVQLMHWGTSALEVRWIQAKDLIGLASADNMDRLARICHDFRYTRCELNAYVRQAQIDPRRSTILARFYMDRKKYDNAVASLKDYVTKTPNDRNAMWLYAQALGEAGRADEATGFYEKLVAAKINDKAERRQIIASYVKHLSRARKFAQAQAVILRMRRELKSPRFMAQEMRIIGAMNMARQTASK
jgi:tetratricopeptide (TPR) repeat protein